MSVTNDLLNFKFQSLALLGFNRNIYNFCFGFKDALVYPDSFPPEFHQRTIVVQIAVPEERNVGRKDYNKKLYSVGVPGEYGVGP